MLFFQPGILFAQDEDKISSPEMIKLYKPQYHLNLGSSYSYFPSLGGGMNMYANPSVAVPLSKRFFVEAGILAATSKIPGLSPFEMNNSIRNFNSLAIYGSTIYQVNSKLTFYGTGIKQLMNTQLPFPLSPVNHNNFSIGSSLKLGNNITIGASVNFSDYYNLYNPIGSGSSGFRHSPFFW